MIRFAGFEGDNRGWYVLVENIFGECSHANLDETKQCIKKIEKQIKDEIKRHEKEIESLEHTLNKVVIYKLRLENE